MFAGGYTNGMSQTIAAVFDSGIFRPLEPVSLAQGTQVVVQLDAGSPALSDEADAETQQAWREYLNRMEALPDRSPNDGLTSRDHDRIIYGV